MLIGFTALILAVLFSLPFVPGIVELIRKQDAEPLFVSMDYMRNPRYFGKSFRKILKTALADSKIGPGMRTLMLSKEEKVEVTQFVHYGENMAIDHLVHAIGSLTSDDGVLFNKEAYVTGNVALGRENIFQAIAADGDIVLGEGTKCRRWIDADGIIRAGRNCRLGISVSSGDALFLEKNCFFHRLFGMPIVTGRKQNGAGYSMESPRLIKELQPNGLSFITVRDRVIPSGSIINEDVVFLLDVHIGSGVRFKGSIKSRGKVTMEENVVVENNIFSDGDISVGKNAKIHGHIFSQMTVHIAGQSVVGCPDTIKSVVGKKAVFLEPDVTIYGFVTTEGEGRTIEQELCEEIA